MGQVRIIDKLTTTLVETIAEELKRTNQCDYYDVLRNLGWGIHRYDQQDWGEAKQLTEEKLGKEIGMQRIELFSVDSIFIKWRQSGPRARQKIEDDYGNPQENPKAYCAVNKKPGGLIMLGLATPGMLDYVAKHKLQHIDGRVKGAARLADTATLEHVASNGVDRKVLADQINRMIPPVPDAVKELPAIEAPEIDPFN